MSQQVELIDFGDFDKAFGDLGLKVGPRNGPNKRTKDEKEWYVIRRFLKDAIVSGLFSFPLIVRQGSPPDEPDFILKQKSELIFIEITEATSKADQKEMADIAKSNKNAIMLGELGGRFRDGASGKQPEIEWAADIVDAIDRKQGKAVFESVGVARHLIIYPNSNASSLITDEEEELEAAEFLRDSISRNRQRIIQAVKGCLVHVLAKEHVFINITGSFEVRKRSAIQP